jgi:vacuolar-type H+-ATPase subunit E/Vma4
MVGDKMTLEKLAKDILDSAESEAKSLIKTANAQAKEIISEAEERASSIKGSADAKASKEVGKISREIVASARQSNQQEALVARRTELDATFALAKEKLGDSSLAGRASLLKQLLVEAARMSEGKMVIQPTKIDRAALKDASSEFEMGDDVEGLGGFILAAADSSISFDFRFDTLLEDAWSNKRTEINEKLF